MRQLGARERILARIDAALEGRDVPPYPGAPPPEPVGPEPVAAFAAAFRRAGGEVVVLADETAARAWLEGFAEGFDSAAHARGLPAALRPPLPVEDGARAALGVSHAVGAAADTGTLLLDSRAGLRARLLPPVHLVWVDAAAVRDTLSGAMADARDRGLPPTLALHSGPSKSADIGRIVVTGVHGPGRVVVAIVGGTPERVRRLGAERGE